jgi:hypothetical protein
MGVFIMIAAAIWCAWAGLGGHQAMALVAFVFVVAGGCIAAFEAAAAKSRK